MGMTRKKFLPAERYNKSSKKYRSPFGPAGQVDGRTFKRDPRSGALVFNPLPEDMTAPELVHHEREERKAQTRELQEKLNQSTDDLRKTRDEIEELKGIVKTLVNPPKKASRKRSSTKRKK